MPLLKTIVCVLVFLAPAAFFLYLESHLIRNRKAKPTPKYWVIIVVCLTIAGVFAFVP